MQDLTKGARRAIRNLAGIAYERELSRELTKLEERFADWRSGRIDPFELNEAIHKHHDGVSRELFNRHSHGSMLDHVVATAILEGTIQEAEVPDAVREHLMSIVALYRRSPATNDQP